MDHVLGLNSKRIGKISNLPMSITKDKTILEKPDSAAKEPHGPTSVPSPGPTLERQVKDAVNAVMKSACGSNEISRVATNRIAIVTKK